MGIGLIAVGAVLLLGAGVMILVANLGKARGSSATIDQIQTYGYVAEIDGRLGDRVCGAATHRLDRGTRRRLGRTPV